MSGADPRRPARRAAPRYRAGKSRDARDQRGQGEGGRRRRLRAVGPGGSRCVPPALPAEPLPRRSPLARCPAAGPARPGARSRAAASPPRLFITRCCFQPKISLLAGLLPAGRGAGWLRPPHGQRGAGHGAPSPGPGPSRAGPAAAARGSPGMRASGARRDFYGKLQRRSGGRSQGALGSAARPPPERPEPQRGQRTGKSGSAASEHSAVRPPLPAPGPAAPACGGAGAACPARCPRRPSA